MHRNSEFLVRSRPMTGFRGPRRAVVGRRTHDPHPSDCLALDTQTVAEHGEPFAGLPRAMVGPVPVLWVDRRTALDEVLRAMSEKRRLALAFCNAHTMRLAHRDHGYAALLRRFSVLNDGVGMDIAARMVHGRRFPSNLNGTDFVPELLAHAPAGTRIYLLGARAPVVARAADMLRLLHPEHAVVGLRDGYFSDADVPALLADIATARPDILLVAMGNPRQEQFIDAHADRIAATVSIGVGALFDFLAGEFPRAPQAVRSLGFEWGWRLLHEPRRLLERYTVGNMAFLWHTLKYKYHRDRQIGAARRNRSDRTDAPRRTDDAD